jgi:hypothetical protein
VGLGVALAGVVVAGVAIYVSAGPRGEHADRRQHSEIAWQLQRVDLSPYAATRSAAPERQDQPIRLYPVPTNLAIELPFGSPHGEYEVEVGRGAADAIVLAKGKGQLDATGNVEIRLDLSTARGTEWIRVRRQNSEWRFYPLRVSD